MRTVDAATKSKAWPIAVGEGPSMFIIGAGLGGISLGLELDVRGLTNWMMFDKAAGVGGTWWTNRYPGCRCDVPAIAYSHSKHLNPNWTETHPERAEIQQYWESLAKSGGQWARIKLRKQALRAEWDSADHAYYITVRDLSRDAEHVYRANILINATGVLSSPRYIPLPGQESFAGTVIHASDWPEDLGAEQLRGKTVVVVGNGCSGVQIVGTLGTEPAIDLVHLARGKQWFVPNPPGENRHSVAHTPEQIARWNRWPGLLRVQRLLAQVIMDSKFHWYKTKEGAGARKRLEDGIGKWMKDTLPEYMRETAIPDYSFGGRRLIYEDGYFAALHTDHVKYIVGKIARVHDNVVVLDDGREIPADYVILATGYDAEHQALDVLGSDDATTNYKSKAEWKTYRGVGLPGIPNYFTVLGNHMGLNHMSISSVLEIQAAYIGRLVQAMRDYRLPELQVKQSATDAYEAWIERRLDKMVWYQVSNYWRANGGTGRIFTHYPGSVARLMWENTNPVWKDWEGAGPVRRWQRVRRVLWFLVLVLVGYWGGRNTALGARITALVGRRIGLMLRSVKGLVGDALPVKGVSRIH